MRSFTRFFVLILLSQSVIAQGNFIKDSLDTYINREIKRWNLPGLAITVVKDGKVIVMKGYGYADLEKKTPVTENTEFQIASNSKAFTGTSLALLQYYGKLKLDDKVKTYLPYFNMCTSELTQKVTIRDVLSHQIGYETFQTDLLNWAGTKTRKELIENMVNVTPRYGFREKYGYCNMGFVTAGEIIPAVTDTTWDDYLKYHYFKPLGMNSTQTMYDNFITSPKASKAYTFLNGNIFEIKPSKVDNLGPAGSISSSVNDMSKWVIMQLGDGMYNGKQVVPKDVILETRKPNIMINKKDSFSYGLGWFLKDSHGKKIVLHDGGANGFLSKTVLIPEEKLGFVILTNSDAQYLFEALEAQILNDISGQKYVNMSALYYQGFKEDYKAQQDSIKKLKAEVAAYKSTAADYKKIEGTYVNKVYGKISIESKGNYAEVSFQFHPQYKGKIQFKSPTAMMIEYNDASSLGVKEINFSDNGSEKTIEIKVTEFVDMDTYLFTRLNDKPEVFPGSKK